MEKYGVDLFLDIHGDEEIPYVFTAGCEGNPGYTRASKGWRNAFAAT
jgi:murein tripeptide amidase MpaA